MSTVAPGCTWSVRNARSVALDPSSSHAMRHYPNPLVRRAQRRSRRAPSCPSHGRRPSRRGRWRGILCGSADSWQLCQRLPCVAAGGTDLSTGPSGPRCNPESAEDMRHPPIAGTCAPATSRLVTPTRALGALLGAEHEQALLDSADDDDPGREVRIGAPCAVELRLVAVGVDVEERDLAQLSVRDAA